MNFSNKSVATHLPNVTLALSICSKYEFLVADMHLSLTIWMCTNDVRPFRLWFAKGHLFTTSRVIQRNMKEHLRDICPQSCKCDEINIDLQCARRVVSVIAICAKHRTSQLHAESCCQLLSSIATAKKGDPMVVTYEKPEKRT